MHLIIKKTIQKLARTKFVYYLCIKNKNKMYHPPSESTAQKQKNMKASTKIAAIAAIAAINPEGFTVNAKTLQPVTSGYAVAVKATQNSFGTEGLASVILYAENNKDITAVGGWLDSESGLYYYDAVVIVGTIEEARAIAEREEQLAFFCLHEMKEYRI